MFQIAAGKYAPTVAGKTHDCVDFDKDKLGFELCNVPVHVLWLSAVLVSAAALVASVMKVNLSAFGVGRSCRSIVVNK